MLTKFNGKLVGLALNAMNCWEIYAKCNANLYELYAKINAKYVKSLQKSTQNV